MGARSSHATRCVSAWRVERRSTQTTIHVYRDASLRVRSFCSFHSSSCLFPFPVSSIAYRLAVLVVLLSRRFLFLLPECIVKRPLRLIGRYDFAIRDYCFKLNLIKLNVEGLSNRIVRSQGSFFRLELVLRNNSKENLHR